MKKILFSIIFAALITCLFVIGVSASSYDTSRKVTLDDNTECALYDADGYALTWYMNGTTLTSKRTIDLINVNSSGWISYKTDVEGFGGASNVVVANFQEPKYEGNVANKIVGFNITYRYSTVLEYIYFADEITKFNQWYTFSATTKLKVAEFTENSQLTSFLQYMFHEATALKSFYVPAGVSSIPTGDGNKYGYMYGCTALESVTFGENSQLTFVGKNAFMKCTSLTELTLPDSVTTVENNIVRESGIINSPFTENSRCTSFGMNIFYKCASLENVIIPKGITQTQDETNNDGGLFDRCTSLTTVTFAKGSECTFIGTRTFNGCSSLVNINLPDTVETLGAYVFSGCSSLKEITIPNSVVTIKSHAFMGCTSLEVIRMGASFAYFNNTGDNSFTYNAGNVKEIYIPKSFYATVPETTYQVSYAFYGASANCKFFYCGTVAEFEIAKANFLTQTSATKENSKFLNATVITYANYLKEPTKYESGRYVICEYNTCAAFYDDSHNVEKINDCQGKCSRCPQTVVLEDAIHTSSWVFTDVDGNEMNVSLEILASYVCKFCKTVEEKENIPTIFLPIGYSKPEDGDPSLGYEVSINHKSLNRYEELSGETVQYGLLAGVTTKESNGTPISIDEEGKLQVESNAVIVNMTGSDYTNVEIKIAGINASTVLYCNAYAVIGANVSYVCETASNKASKIEITV